MAANIYLVTGAGRDIGQAIAERLAGPESMVIAHYANSGAGASETLARIETRGGAGVLVQADFTRDGDVTRFISDVEQILDGRRLMGIVFNAAATAATPLGNAPIGTLHQMLTANILAPQRIVDALSPQIADGGAILALSIASVRQVFSPDFAFFSATKAAVDVLIKGWAVALGSRGIRANALAPGVVEANFRAELLKDPAFRAALEGATALGRPGQIEDIAEVADFLLSPAARWVTGQIIDASGGWKL